ncbi:MAG: 2-C-methyl-D-erythritol 4-phosphate cytidylyltransferase [Clostridia bacterium]|nr:2-C-methyl-D-erythritol 4-phosphate cytidylyltransferase [Clostridia bacterium]
MKLFDKLRDIFAQGDKKKHPFTSAVIVAGGNGVRLGSETPKQHLMLCGRPIVVHAMLAFEKCELIDEIVAVCREGEEALYDEYKSKYGIAKLKCTVRGGNTRSDSALAGFEAVSEKCKYVAIHDAARCLITPDDIENVINEAYKHRAATAAVKATDTIKLADENGFVSETVDRERVYLAATPQIFKHELYMTAAYAAKKDGAVVTDDNSLAERLGFKVKLVPCNGTNIKITKPEDLIFAESVIKALE